jgi:hypothetical protein
MVGGSLDFPGQGVWAEAQEAIKGFIRLDPSQPNPGGTATILPLDLQASATSPNQIPCVRQATAPSRRDRHVRRHSTRRLPMRVYVEVVLTIIGLIGAYAALLPLVT